MFVIGRGVVINGKIIAVPVIPGKPFSGSAEPQIIICTTYHCVEDRIGMLLINNITFQGISIIPHKTGNSTYPDITKIILFDKSYLGIGQAFLLGKVVKL